VISESVVGTMADPTAKSPLIPTFGEPFDLPQGRECVERLRSSRFSKGGNERSVSLFQKTEARIGPSLWQRGDGGDFM